MFFLMWVNILVIASITFTTSDTAVMIMWVSLRVCVLNVNTVDG